ncbi:putative thiamine transporter SLC35F3 [Channa argus]|uniref:Putative thiamine transporter SLC35F3 n=1 Tax=Channa argus TaxID=215402 RepID=A0A6G1R0A4_CHAAH|nr:putative thiamine transporter SLC35F3 [Channa argus]
MTTLANKHKPNAIDPAACEDLCLGAGRVAERELDGVGGGLFRELHGDIAGPSHPDMGRLCKVLEQAVRQGSAGTFGICSYQQERSALQRLQGKFESFDLTGREERSRENVVGTTDAQSVGGGTGAESGSNRRRLHCCIRVTTLQVRKALWGVAMVMCVCSSWAGSTQLAKLTFKQFDAPFTLTWFATTWNCLFFPLYYVGHLCKSAERQTPRQRFRECCRFFGDDGLTPKVFFTKVAPFGLLWILTNYLYLQALRKINTTDVSALFCCNKAFVFLLSWIVLRDRFMGVRIVAAILAIAGIVMMTYADGFHSHSVIGITLVVASASMSALYKVLFKMVLGSAKFGEAALFLSIVGSANFVFLSFVPVILYFTHVEYIGSLEDIPWGYLCGVAGLLFAFNVLVNFGIAITYPTLISLGIVLSVPVNAMVDLYTCEIHFNTVRLIAVFIICLGFLMLLLPEDWDQCIIQLISKLRKRDNPAESNGEAGATTGLNWRGRARTSISEK